MAFAAPARSAAHFLYAAVNPISLQPAARPTGLHRSLWSRLLLDDHDLDREIATPRMTTLGVTLVLAFEAACPAVLDRRSPWPRAWSPALTAVGTSPGVVIWLSSGGREAAALSTLLEYDRAGLLIARRGGLWRGHLG